MKFEEILPDYVEKENEHYRAKVINETIVDCREKLEKAVSDGKLCLDPPTTAWIYEKIYDIMKKEMGEISGDMCRIAFEIAETIFSRIRNGRER